MTYLLIFYEFFKTGLFAIGGGLVTIPFVFEMSGKYGWFSIEEATDYAALSQAVPGAIGVNLAVFSGNAAAGILGGITAGIGLTLPSLIIIIILARFLKTYREHPVVCSVLNGVRPAGIALIFFAAAEIVKVAIFDWVTMAMCLAIIVLMLRFRRNPVFYVILSAAAGLVLKL